MAGKIGRSVVPTQTALNKSDYYRILSQLILKLSVASTEKKTCLTGYMTEVQLWVNEEGAFTSYADRRSTIDVSRRADPILYLETKIQTHFIYSTQTVRFLSLAKCDLTEIPHIAMLKDSQGRQLTLTVEYYTLYGNSFGSNTKRLMGSPSKDIEKLDIKWAADFRNQYYPNLIELDLRKCSIEVIDDNIFRNMPKLKALYLGENDVHFIKDLAFNGLSNLQYLDLSRKLYDDRPLMFETGNVLSYLTNLKTLDLSFTKLSSVDFHKLFHFGRSLQKLSLCEAKLNYSEPFMFHNTSLKILDVSGNHQILNNRKALYGIEGTLEIIYADQVNLKSFEVFNGFEKLKVLKISKNDLSFIRPETALTLKKLKILDIDSNRFSTWFEPTFSLMPSLKFLSLRDNNINFMSDEIMKDLQNISYISLAKNYVICNCYTREFMMLAYYNEKNKVSNRIQPPFMITNYDPVDYNIAFMEFNKKIDSRRTVADVCSDDNSCDEFHNNHEILMDGKYIIFDYDSDDYQCLLTKNGTYVPFVYNTYCEGQTRATYEEILKQNKLKLFLLLLIPPNLILIYILRKKIKFFCTTMRNSTLLSMMEQPGSVNDGTLFNYDVFVSYCNEDRAWVLDNFLPQIERESGISVCLHERDFQVGLSILENIVSCMDRSRCIMLILSQKFLLSRWCQFEMHLAQHRLLETRREDLILILLEEIPKKLRPNTLHYLMMTKTYLVWPKEKDQQKLFWTRLKKSLVTQKMKYMDNVSIV